VTLSEALGLGIVQGATEFLPISSSGHLVLVRSLWPGADSPQLLFDVVVHLGTLAAIVLILRRRIAALVVALVELPRRGTDSPDARWLGLIALSCVPTAVIGYALRSWVEGMHSRPAWVGAALLVTALLLLSADRFPHPTRGHAEIGWVDAVLVGIVQGFAVIPGISRSGATVVAALSRGVRGDAAVEFSMLISIPAVLGANVLEGMRAGVSSISAEAGPLSVGFVAALVAGALSLKALMWAVRQRRLRPFAAYCALVGIGAVVLGVA
jgi:undecaprenyl-diphosphatase